MATKTKNELLEQALKDTAKYVHTEDADLSLVSAYLRDLAGWIDAPETDSSDPNNPPPPPPGHS